MKDVRRINSRVQVERNIRMKTTAISVIVDGEKTVLADMKTNDYFWLKYEHNDRYIVVYSRGCMVNQIPLKVEAAYDIKNEKVVEIKRKNQVILEYMLIGKKQFEIGTILEFINDCLLNVASKEETEDFKRYLTAENPNITRERIKEYIISCYPVLSMYCDYDYIITVMEYREIMEKLGNNLCFHIMPEALDK